MVARVTRESGASEEDDETISWGKRNTGHEKDDRETEVAKRGAPSRAERRLLWRRRAGASVEPVLVHDPGVAPMVRPYAFPKSRHDVYSPSLTMYCALHASQGRLFGPITRLFAHTHYEVHPYSRLKIDTSR